jgi:hypothetical protein
MTTTVRTTATTRAPTTRVPMTSLRKTALVAGALYLLTFVSIPTLFLYAAVKSPMIVALAGIGTAVALFPVLRRQNEGVALGLVGVRTLEAATIFAGAVTLLTVVALRQAGVGADALVTGHTLVTMYNRTFLIGQSFMPVVDDLLLGYLLYQSRLVPRILPRLAFIGAALLVTSDVAVLFNLLGQTSAVASLSALPIALFEFSLGVWLIVKGFNTSPILAIDARDDGLNRSPAPAAVAR